MLENKFDVQRELEEATHLSWEEIRSCVPSLAMSYVRNVGGRLKTHMEGMKVLMAEALIAAPMSYGAKEDTAREWGIDTNRFMALLAED